MSELFREGLRRLEQEEEWRSIQQDAKRAGLDKMSMREIDAEVASARKDMRAKTRKSTKRSGK